MRDRVLSERVLYMARVLAGISSSYVPDKKGTVGLLADMIVSCESNSPDLPSDRWLRHTDRKTWQHYVLFVSCCESVVK